LKQHRRNKTITDDLRSVKSEYDYENKKTFLDVLGQNKPIKTRLNGGAGLNILPLGQQIIYMDDEN